MTTAIQTQTRITGPHKNRLKWGIEAYEKRRWIEVAATEGSRKDAERLEREIAVEREQEIIATTKTQPTITLSNFRVTCHAPRYEDSKVLYDGYCAILADDAEHGEVRVFDVPDVDEGQLAAALFACDAMNQHERLMRVTRLAQYIAKQQDEGLDITAIDWSDLREAVFDATNKQEREQ